jgi:hypothetical protein
MPLADCSQMGFELLELLCTQQEAFWQFFQLNP